MMQAARTGNGKAAKHGDLPGKPKEMTVRFRTKAQRENLERAAKRAERSLNWYVLRAIDRAVEHDLKPPEERA